MKKIEIYCDESCHEALVDKNAHNFLSIGGVWIPSNKRDDFKLSIKEIKLKYNVKGEFKWNKVSPAYLPFYKEIIEFFFETDYLNYRCVVIDSHKVKNEEFNNNDPELGFYKFYYQLLRHKIETDNHYNIFVDYKIMRDRSRLHVLKEILNNQGDSVVDDIQSIHSGESIGVQLADFLTGVVTAHFNEKTKSKAKLEIIEKVKGYTPIHHTSKSENKFNIFKIKMGYRNGL